MNATCVTCGETDTFPKIEKHVDREHGHGRIEFPDILGEAGGRTVAATPTGTSTPVDESGDRAPDQCSPERGPVSAASPSWTERVTELWIFNCIAKLRARWPDVELHPSQYHDLEILFAELSYEASKQLVDRAVVICERFPGPGELRNVLSQGGGGPRMSREQFRQLKQLAKGRSR